jgi:hypothetical protein
MPTDACGGLSPLRRMGLPPVLGRPGQVATDEHGELAHLVDPGDGGRGGAEYLGSAEGTAGWASSASPR